MVIIAPSQQTATPRWSNWLDPDPRRWIVALRASQTRLHTLVEPLTPAALRARSYATEWAVSQVLSHIGSQAAIFQMFLDAALAGKQPPGRDAFPPIWDAWNRRDPERQARDCLETNDVLITRLENLPDETLAVPIELFGMDLVIGDLARLRLSEHAVHSWDIAVSFDPTAQIAPDAVALLVDTLTPLVARAGKPQGHSFDLHIHSTDPDDDFVLSVGESVELRSFDGTESTDGTLDLPAEALLRLVYGRLDADHTPTLGLSARDVTLDDLRAIFPGF
jgi:uncharacterized protein (TIGR03083 family)